MGAFERVQKAQQELASALAGLEELNNAVEMLKPKTTPTVVDLSPERWVVTAGSGGCQINGLPTGGSTLREGDVYALCRSDQNLVALRTALSKTIEERDNARRSVQNLQEFNDKQRKQLESLQKEMAAIHMCVTADSHTKLDDAMHRNVERGAQAPFLLKTVYEAMVRYFNTKARANDNPDTRALDAIGELLINCGSVSDMMEVFQRYTEKHPAVERVYQCKKRLLRLQALVDKFIKETK